MTDHWVRLTISQVFTLSTKSSTPSLYYHLHQPVQWIRLTGILTAVEDHDQRWLLTLDDGSGLAIQLVIKKELAREVSYEEARRAVEDGVDLSKWVEPRGASMRNIRRGCCVDVKGKVGQFRGVRQLQVVRIGKIENTEMEVESWEKRNKAQRERLAERTRARRSPSLQQAQPESAPDEELDRDDASSAEVGSIRSRQSSAASPVQQRAETSSGEAPPAPGQGSRRSQTPADPTPFERSVSTPIAPPEQKQPPAVTTTEVTLESVDVQIEEAGEQRQGTRAQRRRKNKKLYAEARAKAEKQSVVQDRSGEKVDHPNRKKRRRK